MQEHEALEIIRTLADGVDPRTREPLPGDDRCQSPQVIRALYLAAIELERRVRRLRRDAQLPEKAGAPWRSAEDEELRRSFDSGLTVKDLSVRHQRTPGAIKRRLEKLGRLQLIGSRS
jgi:hypothetical protein